MQSSRLKCWSVLARLHSWVGMTKLGKHSHSLQNLLQLLRCGEHSLRYLEAAEAAIQVLEVTVLEAVVQVQVLANRALHRMIRRHVPNSRRQKSRLISSVQDSTH